MFPRAEDKLDLISFSKIRSRFPRENFGIFLQPGPGCSIVYILFKKKICFSLFSSQHRLSSPATTNYLFNFFEQRESLVVFQEFWKSNFPPIATNFCLLQVLIFASQLSPLSLSLSLLSPLGQFGREEKSSLHCTELYFYQRGALSLVQRHPDTLLSLVESYRVSCHEDNKAQGKAVLIWHRPWRQQQHLNLGQMHIVHSDFYVKTLESSRENQESQQGTFYFTTQSGNLFQHSSNGSKGSSCLSAMVDRF